MEQQEEKQTSQADTGGPWGERPLLVPCLIAAGMLFAALFRWPYGYYSLLRWVVCAAAVLTAYMGHAWKQSWALWLFGFIAILFNPIAPIHLSRPLWLPIDLLAGLAFMLGGAVLAKPREAQREE